jgi:hypothetical protein
MTQAQLNRAVARATGDTVETIQKHGFSVWPQRSRRSAQRPSREDRRDHPTPSSPAQAATKTASAR